MSTPKKIPPWTAASALLLAAVAAYANAFRGGFQFDDFSMLQDPRLAGASTFLHQVGHMVRPLLKLSFLVDRQLFGDHPAGYHLLNLALHIGSGLLLFALLAHTLRRCSFSNPHIFSTVPFWTALLFLLHPLQTETVTYISGRATGMAAFFCLLSLYLFVRSSGAAAPRKAFLLGYGGSLAAFVLALLAKETAVTLPAALLLWDVALGRRSEGGSRLRLHWPFWAVLVGAVAMACLHPRYAYLARASLETRPLYANLLTQANTVIYALTLFVLPQRLNFDHDLSVYHSFWQWPTPLSFALLAAAVVVAWWSRRRAPFFSFGVLWFFLNLLPTNSLVPRYDLLSERNLYLPSIGVFLAVVSLAAQWTAKAEPQRSAVYEYVAKFIFLLAAIGLLFATLSRNRIYTDQATFWTDAVHKSPQKARPHNNLGYAYLLAGDLDRAMDEFRTALSLDRNFTSAQENLLHTWTLKQHELTGPRR